MIKTACHVPTSYKTPDWRKLGGAVQEKLDKYMGEVTTKFKRDVSVFGLSCYGDGATLMKCLTTNVLFSGKCLYFSVYE